LNGAQAPGDLTNRSTFVGVSPDVMRRLEDQRGRPGVLVSLVSEPRLRRFNNVLRPAGTRHLLAAGLIVDNSIEHSVSTNRGEPPMSAFPIRRGAQLSLLAFGILMSSRASGAAPVAGAPATFDVADRPIILTAHAEGAQLYQCESGADGHMKWAFREPIATLISEGKTIGRHYAGPRWEFDDGGAIKGQLLTSAPGASANDIPLLKLSASEHRGAGALSGVSLILRLNTHGGALAGACAVAGEFRAQPYSADYVFLR
jgi:hypothetical protein